MCPRRLQQVQPCRVTIVDLGSVSPHEIDLRRVDFESCERNVVHGKDARNDLPKAAKPRDDDVIRRVVHRIEGAVRFAIK